MSGAAPGGAGRRRQAFSQTRDYGQTSCTPRGLPAHLAARIAASLAAPGPRQAED